MKLKEKEIRVDFGLTQMSLSIQNDREIIITIIEDGGKSNFTETVPVNLTELRSALYLITWCEPNGNTVVQIQDHLKGYVYMSRTFANGEFVNITGRICNLSYEPEYLLTR